MENRKNSTRKQLSTILAEELKRLRKSRGWTLTQLAIQADEFVTPQALGLYEKGMRMPSIEVVSKLAEVYNIDKDDLIECRANAILETCTLLGDDAPPAIRNERNMLVHGQQSGGPFIKIEGSEKDIIKLVAIATKLIKELTDLQESKGITYVDSPEFAEASKKLESINAKIQDLSAM